MSDSNYNLKTAKPVTKDESGNVAIKGDNGTKATGSITIPSATFTPGDSVTITSPLAVDYTFEESVDFSSGAIAATGGINFSVNPAPGDQVTLTVAGIPYVFIADTDFTIGVDASETSFNLRDAINNTAVLQGLVFADVPA